MSTCYRQLETLEPRYLMSAAAPLTPIATTALSSPVTTPASLSQNEQKLAADNSAFAFNLYHQLEAKSGNIFFSPLSISAAMAMLYAGANGPTAQQIANVMSFLLPNGDFSSAFGSLLADLTSPQAANADGQTPTLDIANSMWGQTGFPFLNSYLQTLSQSFQSEMHSVDFADAPEAQRDALNQWVADNTDQMIQNLFPEGSISNLTRLVLANAIYFNAPWLYSFDQTVQQAFHLPGGDVNVDMMKQKEYYSYASGSNYQAVEIPYVGNESMVVLLPKAGQFQQFDSSLTAAKVQAIEQQMQLSEVNLSLPKFGYEQATDLSQTLQNMGITDAFDADRADLSGMDGNQDLSVSAVIHKAKIEVSAQGTKAAAATAIIMQCTCVGYYQPPPPPIDFTVDHPFIYLIKDNTTGSTLFMGRVSDAKAFSAPTAPVADPVAPPPQNPIVPGGPTHVVFPPQKPTVKAGASSFAATIKYSAFPVRAPFVAGGASVTAVYGPRIAPVAGLHIASGDKTPVSKAATTPAIDVGNDILTSNPAGQSSLTGATDDLDSTLFPGVTQHRRI